MFAFRSKHLIFTLSLMLCGAFILGRLASAANHGSVHGAGERDGVLLTVSAILKGSGESNGQAMFHNRNTNSKLSIDVDTVVILFTDRSARISGEVTRSTGSYMAAFPVGGRATFAVEDNGEGPEALSDEFSLPSPKPFNIAVDETGGALLPLSERGNFRITGEE